MNEQIPTVPPDRVARGTCDGLDLVLDRGGVYPAQDFLPDGRRVCIAMWYLDKVDPDLKMTGTTVIWYDHEPSVPDDYPSGWVAHAMVSDGTLSWPMGAESFTDKAYAEEQAKYIIWTDTGPCISVRWWSIQQSGKIGV